MFILDSLMISGLRWVLDTALTAAEAEMNDDSALRDQLLEAEMRREMGEISDEAFKATEADLLARIREIRERREGAGPLALGAPMETASGGTFQVEAELSGDFHDSQATPETTVVAVTPTTVDEVVVTPERANALRPTTRTARTARTARTPRTPRTTRTTRTIRTSRTIRTTKKR